MMSLLTSVTILCSVAIIVFGILQYQKIQIEFLNSRVKVRDTVRLGVELETRLKEVEEYKKRVDALMLKAGFKL